MAAAVINNTNTNPIPDSPLNPTISNVNTPNPTNKPGINKIPKIPNTIIFYIKTRIANYYKLNYDPSMSVPKINSHTVFINPLVEYTKRAIFDLPNDAPKDLLLTQFFLPNQFDSLINRILSSFTSMQSTRTLAQAKEEGVIDTNIQLTIETLFKRNNILYINNRPYTIVSNNWNKGDWELDTKPIEQLITPFAPLKGDELESAEKELNDLGEGVRLGNASAAGIKDDNEDAKTANSDKLPESDEAAAAEKAKLLFVKPEDNDILDEIPPSLDYLLKDGLIKNDPIGCTSMTNKMTPCTPLTFLFLIDDKQLKTFVLGSVPGLELYNKYTEARKAVLDATDLFFDLIMIDFGVMKKSFDDVVLELKRFIDEINKKIQDRQIPKQTEINTAKNQVKYMNQQKNEYMKSLYNLSNALLDIFNKQQQYFVSVVDLLMFIKDNYRQIIGYTRKTDPLLAQQCIDLDIDIFKGLSSNNTPTGNMIKNREKRANPTPTYNPDLSIYSDAYNQTIQDYKTKHSEWFTTIFMNQYVKNSVMPNINESVEMEKYKANPDLIDIEHRQYTIYMLVIMLYAFMNQSDIWRIYFVPMSDFITNIQASANKKITDADTKKTAYETFTAKLTRENSPVLTDDELLDNITEKEKKDKARASDRASGESKISFGDIMSVLNSDISEQESKYIDLTITEIDAYEHISLYIYLLELQCLRQHSLYVSEENINQIYIEIADNSGTYYDDIQKCLTAASASTSAAAIQLPKSLMWDISKINEVSTIEARINSNDVLRKLYISKKYSIKYSIDALDTYCDTISKMIDPVIDTNGLTEMCDNLKSIPQSNTFFTKFPQFIPRIQKWILNELKDYDIQSTNELNSQLKQVIRMNRLSGYEFPNDCQDWIVLRDDTDLNGLLDPNTGTTVTDIIQMLNVPNSNMATVIQTVFAKYKTNLIIFDLTNFENTIKENDFVVITVPTSSSISATATPTPTPTSSASASAIQIYKVITIDGDDCTIQSMSNASSAPETKPKSELKKYVNVSIICEALTSANLNTQDAKFMYFVKTDISDPASKQEQILIPSLNSEEPVARGATGIKYELVFDHIKNKLIYGIDDINEIPDDIIMFLSDTCAAVQGTAIAVKAKTLPKKPAIENKENLDLLAENKLDVEDLVEENTDLEGNIELADTCLQKISGTNFKKGYEDKTLYQYLIEEEDDLTTFLDNFGDNYFKEDSKLTSSSSEKGIRTKFQNKIKAILNTPLLLNDYQTTIKGFKKILEDYKKKLSTKIDENNIEIDRKKEDIDAGKSVLKDEGIYLDEEESRIKRTKETPIADMEQSELQKERKKDGTILRKIEEILLKTSDTILKKKYTEYKNVYETKLEEIKTALKAKKGSKEENVVGGGEGEGEEEGVEAEEAEEGNNSNRSSKVSVSRISRGGPISGRISGRGRGRDRERGRGSGSGSAEGSLKDLTGGRASEEYYSSTHNNQAMSDQQPIPYGQQPIPYGQQPIPYGQQPILYGQQPIPYGQQPLLYGQQPMGYPGQQQMLMNMNQYSHTNRALELTSKLAYYVSIELELYPGTSVNTIQMAAVKCASTFERIRESIADIRGVQYRPGVMDESYTYQNLPMETNNKSIEENRGKEENRETTNNQMTPKFGDLRRTNQTGGSIKHRKHKRRSVSCKIYSNK